jgi:TolB-like protein
MRLFTLSLLLATGCATVLRPSGRTVTVYGPPEMRVLDNGRDLHAQQSSPGQYVADLSKDAKGVTVESEGVQATVPLSTHLSIGWLIPDILFGVLPALVDAMTGQLTSFDDADATAMLKMAGRSTVPSRSATPAPSPPSRRTLVVASGKLAVLDFKNSAKDLSTADVRYFADVIRGATLKSAPGLEVMTRENLLVLLQATGKDLGQCEGECEVDTGRRIGADAIISGDVLKVGSKYHISLRLHETHDGRLLSSAIATGKTVDELDETLQSAADELLTPSR